MSVVEGEREDNSAKNDEKKDIDDIIDDYYRATIKDAGTLERIKVDKYKWVSCFDDFMSSLASVTFNDGGEVTKSEPLLKNSYDSVMFSGDNRMVDYISVTEALDKRTDPSAGWCDVKEVVNIDYNTNNNNNVDTDNKNIGVDVIEKGNRYTTLNGLLKRKSFPLPCDDLAKVMASINRASREGISTEEESLDLFFIECGNQKETLSFSNSFLLLLDELQSREYSLFDGLTPKSGPFSCVYLHLPDLDKVTTEDPNFIAATIALDKNKNKENKEKEAKSTKKIKNDKEMINEPKDVDNSSVEEKQGKEVSPASAAASASFAIPQGKLLSLLEASLSTCVIIRAMVNSYLLMYALIQSAASAAGPHVLNNEENITLTVEISEILTDLSPSHQQQQQKAFEVAPGVTASDGDKNAVDKSGGNNNITSSFIKPKVPSFKQAIKDLNIAAMRCGKANPELRARVELRLKMLDVIYNTVSANSITNALEGVYGGGNGVGGGGEKVKGYPVDAMVKAAEEAVLLIRSKIIPSHDSVIAKLSLSSPLPSKNDPVNRALVEKEGQGGIGNSRAGGNRDGHLLDLVKSLFFPPDVRFWLTLHAIVVRETSFSEHMPIIADFFENLSRKVFTPIEAIVREATTDENYAVPFDKSLPRHPPRPYNTILYDLISQCELISAASVSSVVMLRPLAACFIWGGASNIASCNSGGGSLRRGGLVGSCSNVYYSMAWLLLLGGVTTLRSAFKGRVLSSTRLPLILLRHLSQGLGAPLYTKIVNQAHEIFAQSQHDRLGGKEGVYDKTAINNGSLASSVALYRLSCSSDLQEQPGAFNSGENDKRTFLGVGNVAKGKDIIAQRGKDFTKFTLCDLENEGTVVVGGKKKAVVYDGVRLMRALEKRLSSEVSSWTSTVSAVFAALIMHALCDAGRYHRHLFNMLHDNEEVEERTNDAGASVAIRNHASSRSIIRTILTGEQNEDGEEEGDSDKKEKDDKFGDKEEKNVESLKNKRSSPSLLQLFHLLKTTIKLDKELFCVDQPCVKTFTYKYTPNKHDGHHESHCQDCQEGGHVDDKEEMTVTVDLSKEYPQLQLISSVLTGFVSDIFLECLCKYLSFTLLLQLPFTFTTTAVEVGPVIWFLLNAGSRRMRLLQQLMLVPPSTETEKAKLRENLEKKALITPCDGDNIINIKENNSIGIFGNFFSTCSAYHHLVRYIFQKGDYDHKNRKHRIDVRESFKEINGNKVGIPLASLALTMRAILEESQAAKITSEVSSGRNCSIYLQEDNFKKKISFVGELTSIHYRYQHLMYYKQLYEGENLSESSEGKKEKDTDGEKKDDVKKISYYYSLTELSLHSLWILMSCGLFRGLKNSKNTDSGRKRDDIDIYDNIYASMPSQSLTDVKHLIDNRLKGLIITSLPQQLQSELKAKSLFKDFSSLLLQDVLLLPGYPQYEAERDGFIDQFFEKSDSIGNNKSGKRMINTNKLLRGFTRVIDGANQLSEFSKNALKDLCGDYSSNPFVNNIISIEKAAKRISTVMYLIRNLIFGLKPKIDDKNSIQSINEIADKILNTYDVSFIPSSFTFLAANCKDKNINNISVSACCTNVFESTFMIPSIAKKII